MVAPVCAASSGRDDAWAGPRTGACGTSAAPVTPASGPGVTGYLKAAPAEQGVRIPGRQVSP
ncbi:hypothetical protein [Streptomyces halobius]|uniref:Uncharacterized protein n=1 Tax=Streptomyces halobius TaxID=2879846 RepID=A0ABY4MB63_9ACTN|nr:hypothetical protein [Streptomyces halobius]UQA94378.1 hypothetical protein K9S39_23195 [Streptomyces halobius]